MKKKSLVAFISLAAVFGLASCNKFNNKKVTTETTVQEDTKNVEEAYKVLDSKMSYEAFQATVLLVMLAFAIFAVILYFNAMKRGEMEKIEKFDSRQLVDKAEAASKTDKAPSKRK